MKTIKFILFLFISANCFGQSISELINKVDGSGLEVMLKEFSGEISTVVNGSTVTILNRQSHQNDISKDYLVQKLESFGNLSVTSDAYSTNGTNVIATQTGSKNPNKVLVICGHYDTVTNYCADDNATGTVAILEVACVLSQYCFDNTIQYILFDEEEIGLLGSKHYVTNFSSSQNLIGAINLDMMGYDKDQADDAPIHVRDKGNSIALKDDAVSILNTYSTEIGLTPNVVDPGIDASDNYHFWLNGKTAIMISDADGFSDLSPHYHSSNDRVSTLDLPYYYKMVRFFLGLTAKKAVISQTQNCNDLNNPDFELGKKPLIYPNPTDQFVTIDLFDNVFNEASVTIRNSLGVTIFKKPINNLVTKIDLANIKPGLYIITVNNSGKHTSQKLILK